MQQYIIAHQPRPMELSEIKNSEKSRNQLDNTTDTSSAHPKPSYSYDKFNEITDIPSKK